MPPIRKLAGSGEHAGPKGASKTPCQHSAIHLHPSAYSGRAGFKRPDERARLAATLKSGRVPNKLEDSDITAQADAVLLDFPAPLVLPGDALAYDPEEPPQSLRSWHLEKARNKPTAERRTLYVAAPPRISESVGFMGDWVIPSVRAGQLRKNSKGENAEDGREERFSSQLADETITYLRAFYHGFNVKLAPSYKWTSWNPSSRSKSKAKASVDATTIPEYIALSDPDTHAATRIRCRQPPDSRFPAQLNLDDILDFCIASLPSDAYAMVLLTEHDLYEDPEDMFCCGRAYGGSRVAVVQSARYDPLLDAECDIPKEHAWPMSHCKKYLAAMSARKMAPSGPSDGPMVSRGAMSRAVVAASSLQGEENKHSLHLSRVLKTVSHELGHTLGIGHCIYYACVMQSTCTVIEDARQPPYLCPVCEAKVGHAVVTEGGRASSGVCERVVDADDGGRRRTRGDREQEDIKAWVRGRNVALKDFCEADERQQSVAWRGLGAWLGAVLVEE